MIRLTADLNKVTDHKFPTKPPSLISSPFQKKKKNSLYLSILLSVFLYNRRIIDVLIYHDCNPFMWTNHPVWLIHELEVPI